jgi:hypothetical protein
LSIMRRFSCRDLTRLSMYRWQAANDMVNIEDRKVGRPFMPNKKFRAR